MPIITLLTDFGTTDEYVGLMKGAILSINPSAVIVDITHNIDPQDVTAAAYAIDSAYGYFPPGTIHAAVVDPEVGSRRKALALQANGHYFCAPDNGILSMVIKKSNTVRAVDLTNADYFRQKVSHIFHGRDIFGPVAAHLSLDVNLNLLGRKLDADDLVMADIPVPAIDSRHRIEGQVISVDRFGNLTTNINADIIAQWRRHVKVQTPIICIGPVTIAGLVDYYAEVPEGQLVALIGSRDLLEISVNRGNARHVLGVNTGEPVCITSK
ncbi:MAG: SAM-dependent chlorinase/fluorinase [Desulfobacteraceae bacterium]|nr:SAM-dependent chlorinase/fluorinase [Desulfobacteraceae bacterium]